MSVKKIEDQPNLYYITSIIVLTLVLPVIGWISEHNPSTRISTYEVFSKWFIFSAVGLRLLFAGLKQVKNPEFTAKQIFHLNTSESFPILRELGFANICFGLVAIVSLFKPEWRIVSAFASGLYYGLAGVQHFLKKTAGINEKFALWTDFIIFAYLLIYFIISI